MDRNGTLGAIPQSAERAGGVTEADLIAKKPAFIETCVRELQEIAHPERIFLVPTLQRLGKYSS